MNHLLLWSRGVTAGPFVVRACLSVLVLRLQACGVCVYGTCCVLTTHLMPGLWLIDGAMDRRPLLAGLASV